MTCWNTDDSTVEPLIVHYKKLVNYMNYKDEGVIVGKGCGTVGMIPDHFYKDAYELGKKIK